MHLSARSRSEEPGPPGQDERRSASPWGPSSRPTRPPLGNIEAARATVERARVKNARENMFEERGWWRKAKSKKKRSYEEVGR